MNLHFALGRLLDRHGQYDATMQQFLEANALKSVQFDIDRHKSFVSELIRVPGKRNLKNPPRADIKDRDRPRPIFIVGMPRSGTSLVSQILCAHPSVYGGGEI